MMLISYHEEAMTGPDLYCGKAIEWRGRKYFISKSSISYIVGQGRKLEMCLVDLQKHNALFSAEAIDIGKLVPGLMQLHPNPDDGVLLTDLQTPRPPHSVA